MPGSAVFLTRAKNDTPPVLAWHVRKNRALHEYVLALTLTVVSTPRVAAGERLTIERVADHYWRAEARYGFMEQPDIPALVAECKARGAEIDLDDVTYYVGHETIVPREDGKGLPLWQESALRRDGAQRRAHQRLSAPALRPRRRDRPRDRNLTLAAPPGLRGRCCRWAAARRELRPFSRVDGFLLRRRLTLAVQCFELL